MSKKIEVTNKNPFELECCMINRRQPYIGIQSSCDKNAIFCIQHNCHMNDQGVMHQMMPLRDFKRKIDQRRFSMQSKVRQIIDSLQKFIDKLIQNIREIKVRKSLQLSMLWLRDLAASEQQYELMKKIYRLDFQNISCNDVKSIYYKIIHNKQLYDKQIGELNCYKGIYQTLNQLNDNKKLNSLVSQKITQIQGVLTNGQILKKLLPDRRILNESLKQVLLQQKQHSENFKISYNKALYLDSSSNFRSIISKYPIISHLTYHIYIKTKYSNVMLGVCNEKLKQASDYKDIHYNQNAISFNCANGNTYKQGMFISGSNNPIRNINQLNIKLRLTDTQMFILTNKCVLMRCSIKNLSGQLFLFFSARTQGDSFQVHCDNDISPDNLKVLQLIKQQQAIKNQPIIIISQEPKINQVQQKNKQKKLENSFKTFNNQLKGSNQSLQHQIFRQNTFGDKFYVKNPITEKIHPILINNEKARQQEPTKIQKIRQSFKNLRLDIQDIDQDQQKKAQQISNQWNIQKKNYLSDIKQKVNMLKQKNISKGSTNNQKRNQILLQKQKQKAKNQPIVKEVHSQSSYRQNSKIIINPNQVSNIKINLSEQVSDFLSGAKNSLISGHRKLSDNINMDEVMKMKTYSQMSQSLEPHFIVKNDQKQIINKMRTPPKMVPFEQRYLTNQLYDL